NANIHALLASSASFQSTLSTRLAHTRAVHTVWHRGDIVEALELVASLDAVDALVDLLGAYDFSVAYSPSSSVGRLGGGVAAKRFQPHAEFASLPVAAPLLALLVRVVTSSSSSTTTTTTERQ